VVLFNGLKKDCFEAQYERGLSVLADKSKGMRSEECAGNATDPVLPVQLSRQLLMVTSLTGWLKYAGAPLCINSAPTADTFFGLYLENWVKFY